MRYKRQLLNLTSQIRRLAFQIWLLAAVPMLAWSQIALVHVTSCGKQAFPSACSIPSSASGNLIVVGFQIGGASNTAITISSIADNAGNTYSEATNARAVV